MKAVVAASLAALFVVTPVLAQTPAPAPASNKPETGCTPSAAASGGQTTGSSNSMAVEKSAIHGQAVETAGRDPRAPVATVAVRCCAVRPPFFIGERSQARPACYVPRLGIESPTVDPARPRVRVEHHPAVGRPGEPV